MARPKKSLSEAVSSEIQANFNLDGFKFKKGLTSKAKFKEQEWIPLSEAYQEVTSVPGIQWDIYVYLEAIRIQERLNPTILKFTPLMVLKSWVKWKLGI